MNPNKRHEKMDRKEGTFEIKKVWNILKMESKSYKLSKISPYRQKLSPGKIFIFFHHNSWSMYMHTLSNLKDISLFSEKATSLVTFLTLFVSYIMSLSEKNDKKKFLQMPIQIDWVTQLLK